MKITIKTLQIMAICSLTLATGCARKIDDKSKKRTLRSAEQNQVQETPNYILFRSIETNDLVQAKQAVIEGANINGINSQGQSALSLAVSLNHVEIMSYLIENGADVNWQNLSGNTVLMLFATQESTETVDIFLTLAGENLNLDTVNRDGDSALMLAIRHQNLQLATKLLLKGARAGNSNLHNEDALTLAETNLPALTELIELSNAYVASSINFAQINHVFASGKQNLIDYLLSRPGFYSRFERWRLLRILVENPRAVDKQTTLAKLLSGMTDINNYSNQYLAIHAAKTRDLATIRTLGTAGLNFGGHDRQGKSALSYAVHNLQVEMVEYLYSKAAPVTFSATINNDEEEVNVCDELPSGRMRALRRSRPDDYPHIVAIKNLLGCD